MRLTLRSRAELDISEAYAWYESRRSGLGAAFLLSVDTCLDRISREPEVHAIHYARVRRARVRRFPYCVYYVIRNDRVDVLAIYHTRRRPRRFERHGTS